MLSHALPSTCHLCLSTLARVITLLPPREAGQKREDQGQDTAESVEKEKEVMGRNRWVRGFLRLLSQSRDGFWGCDWPQVRKVFPKETDLHFDTAGTASYRVAQQPGLCSLRAKVLFEHGSTVQAPQSACRTQGDPLDFCIPFVCFQGKQSQTRERKGQHHLAGPQRSNGFQPGTSCTHQPSCDRGHCFE